MRSLMVSLVFCLVFVPIPTTVPPQSLPSLKISPWHLVTPAVSVVIMAPKTCLLLIVWNKFEDLIADHTSGAGMCLPNITNPLSLIYNQGVFTTFELSDFGLTSQVDLVVNGKIFSKFLRPTTILILTSILISGFSTTYSLM
jgi:hypothetical protein